MKVPIDEVAVIDLDAPVLPAYERRIDGAVRWYVCCKHCREWHDHGPAEGHREAHAGTRAACTGEWGTIWRILEAGIQISGVTTSK